LYYNSHYSQDCGLSSFACICKKTATFNASFATFFTPPLVLVPPVIADLQTGPAATATVFEMAYSAVPILNVRQLCNSSFVVDGFSVGDMNGLYIRDTTRRVGGEATFWDVLGRRYFFWCSSTLSFAMAPSDTWELNHGDGNYGCFGRVATTNKRGTVNAASWSVWNGSSWSAAVSVAFTCIAGCLACGAVFRLGAAGSRAVQLYEVEDIILRKFFEATGGHQWFHKDHWNSSTVLHCAWYG